MIRTVRLGDVLEVQNGFAFKSELFAESNGIPLIRIRDLPNTSTELNYTGEYRDEFLVEPGDFLIGMDGDFRCFRWAGPKGLLNQRVCRLRNFSSDAIPDYIFYIIGKKLAEIHGSTAFVTVKHISSRQILGIEIPLPQLDAQRRIVDVLNRANGIRRLRREALAKARSLMPSLFAEMFGDPATNPKGWRVVTVGELLSDCEYGTSQKASNDGSGVTIIRMGNVSYDGGLRLDELKFVELAPSELEKYRLRHGDILFNRTNSKDLVGKTGLWDAQFEAVAASYFIRLRVRPDLSDPSYVWLFFNTSYMKRRLLETARGAIGQSNINAKEVRAFPIPLPPIDLQHAFVARLADIQSIITQQERAAAAAERLVQSLMAQCFAV